MTRDTGEPTSLTRRAGPGPRDTKPTALCGLSAALLGRGPCQDTMSNRDPTRGARPPPTPHAAHSTRLPGLQLGKEGGQQLPSGDTG